MKSKHIFLGSALLLALIIGIVCWKKNAPAPDAPAKTTVAAKPGVVELPITAPAPPLDKIQPSAVSIVANDANATVLAANHQATLDGLLKFQTELEQSLAASASGRRELARFEDSLSHPR